MLMACVGHDREFKLYSVLLVEEGHQTHQLPRSYYKRDSASDAADLINELLELLEAEPKLLERIKANA